MKKLVLSSLVLISSLFAEYSEVTVYKSPTCDCCHKWIEYMEQNGFKVKAVEDQSMDFVKRYNGVTPQLSSCHTAIVDGYVVEGHVNASDVKKMLDTKPDIKGLTVPGMPLGSPGMEYGKHKQEYDVLAIEKDGSTTVFSKH